MFHGGSKYSKKGLNREGVNLFHRAGKYSMEGLNIPRRVKFVHRGG